MDCGRSTRVLVAAWGCGIVIEKMELIETGLADGCLYVLGTLIDSASWRICVFWGQVSVIYCCLPTRNNCRERMYCVCCDYRGPGGIDFARLSVLASCNGAKTGSQPDAEGLKISDYLAESVY